MTLLLDLLSLVLPFTSCTFHEMNNKPSNSRWLKTFYQNIYIYIYYFVFCWRLVLETCVFWSFKLILCLCLCWCIIYLHVDLYKSVLYLFEYKHRGSSSHMIKPNVYPTTPNDKWNPTSRDKWQFCTAFILTYIHDIRSILICLRLQAALLLKYIQLAFCIE